MVSWDAKFPGLLCSQEHILSQSAMTPEKKCCFYTLTSKSKVVLGGCVGCIVSEKIWWTDWFSGPFSLYTTILLMALIYFKKCSETELEPHQQIKTEKKLHAVPCWTASSIICLNKFMALRSVTIITYFPKACNMAAIAMAPGGPSFSSGGSWLKCVGNPVVMSTDWACEMDRQAFSSWSWQNKCFTPRCPINNKSTFFWRTRLDF